MRTTTVHRVKHCEFDGTAFKPTRLLAINMPTLAARLNEQRKWRDPTTTLVGSDQNGQWRTAQAKEYPPRMSRGLANSMLDAVSSPPIAFPCDDLHSFLEETDIYSPKLSQEEVQDFGADFVDNPLPVGYLTLEWSPPFDMLERANRRFVQTTASPPLLTAI